MIDMGKGYWWSAGRELGWNVPLDLTRGLFGSAKSVN